MWQIRHIQKGPWKLLQQRVTNSACNEIWIDLACFLPRCKQRFEMCSWIQLHQERLGTTICRCSVSLLRRPRCVFCKRNHMRSKYLVLVENHIYLNEFRINIVYFFVPKQTIAQDNCVDNHVHNTIPETQRRDVVKILQKGAREK